MESTKRDDLTLSGATSGHQSPSTTPVSAEPVGGASGGAPVNPSSDDAVLREKLRHMGKSKNYIVCPIFAVRQLVHPNFRPSFVCVKAAIVLSTSLVNIHYLYYPGPDVRFS